MRRFRFVSSHLLIFFLMGSVLFGQAASTGSIRGLVADSTGAVIPGVEVQITNQETGESWTTLSNDSGIYQKTFLPPGVYRVSVSLTGFKTQTTSDLQLSAQATARVDFSLEVGDIGEEVTVESSAAEASMVTSDVSATLTETQIAELPIHSRTFDFFLLQQPGVQLDRTDGYQSFAFNGSHLLGNNYLLDGTDATFIETNSSSTMDGFGGTVNTVSISAIEEIRTSTSNFSAEEGRASGGVVNIISKRGTDSYHGEVYYYHRNTALNANDFFSNRAGDPRPALREHQGGFALGGPIRKDKTFFFGNYEFVRIRRPQTFEIQVPTAQYLARSDIDPAVSSILGLYPGANVDLGDPNIGLFRLNTSPPIEQDLYLFRIDHTFSDRDSAFFRYNIADGSQQRLSSPCFEDCPMPSRGRSQQFTASWIHSFSPSLVNQARFGFNRTLVGFSDRTGFSALDGYGLRFQAGTANTFGRIFSTGEGFVAPQDLDQYYDNLAWTKGRHSFKFGFDLRRVRANRIQGSSLGTAFVTDVEALAANQVNRLQQGNQFQTAGMRNSSWALYAQDDFTVNDKLTLNLGVRWEYNTPYRDHTNRTLQFGPCCFFEETGDFGSVQDVFDGNFLRIGGPLYPADKNNVAPRVGFAFDPTGAGDMVLRGGAGIYYGMNVTPGIGVYNNLFYQRFIENTPINLPGPLDFPLPDLEALPPQPNSYYYFYAGYGPNPYDMRDNYAIHFNLSFEKELGKNTLFSVGYVGNHNLHFADVNFGVNPVNPLTLYYGYIPVDFEIPEFHVPALDAQTGELVGTRTFYSYYYSGHVSFYQPTGRSRYDSLQTSVNYRGPNFIADFNYTWSKYIANTYSAPYVGYYTASGDLTYANGAQDLLDRDGSNRGPHILDTPHAVVGNFVYEIPAVDRFSGFAQHFLRGWTVASIFRVYSGKPFTVNTGNRLENTNLWWGFPTQRPDQAGSIRPDSYGSNDQMINNYFNSGAFGVPAFDASTGLSLGDLGRNSIRGPAFRQVDVSLGKKAYVGWLGEDNFLSLRFDFINVFNNTNFAEPQFNMSSPTFGQIRRTVSAFAGGMSREIQVSLTLKF